MVASLQEAESVSPETAYAIQDIRGCLRFIVQEADNMFRSTKVLLFIPLFFEFLPASPCTETILKPLTCHRSPTTFLARNSKAAPFQLFVVFSQSCR